MVVGGGGRLCVWKGVGEERHRGGGSLPRLSETIWKTGAAMLYSRQASGGGWLVMSLEGGGMGMMRVGGKLW